MRLIKLFFIFIIAMCPLCCSTPTNEPSVDDLKEGFENPPDSARPGVYWYFMDGNMSEKGITEDLESMKTAGIGSAIFLEVKVGIPRGKVDFLSNEWLDLFRYAVLEAKRLGIAISLGVGPGWAGSGGPWVSAKESMKYLVTSSVRVSGNGGKRTVILPKPKAMRPYFGTGNFTPELMKQWKNYYEDIKVLAFPTPSSDFKIKDIDEKALYYRAPYTSRPGVKQFLPSLVKYRELPAGSMIAKNKIIDVSRFLKPDGTLEWGVPKGNWTIMRVGSRSNGTSTRFAPLAGLGFEVDKFDTAALNAHLAYFTGKLFKKIGIPDNNLPGGVKMLHLDSWEMGAQNWSQNFREEFKKRRGYDPLPYYPVYSGMVVGSLGESERFLWDLRQTAQELVIENYAIHLKKYGQKYNLGLSIEPYDMNPTADLELGSVADVPMGEFWSKGYGFNSSFSCIEAASIAHVNGNPVVAAEAFTAYKDAWKQFPGSMKNQGDWAFACGVNRLVYHTFQHQSLNDSLKPGMTMGPFGVHWDRNQTWWPMADGYHRYITRCQYILQQGKSVADILYLTPEGAPDVFRAPSSALTADEVLPDRKGYNFDGCSPSQLYRAIVKDKRIVFPGGASYRLLVLPAIETMTPALLDKIESLVKAGAVIIGNPPRKSPSLVNYPECDQLVASKAMMMWGKSASPIEISEHRFGKGKIYWGGTFSNIHLPDLYPNYDSTATLLKKMGIQPDFESTEAIRYTHRSQKTWDIYFVSNKTNRRINVVCIFRVSKGVPELWDPLTGETRLLPDFVTQHDRTQIPLEFEPYQSFFIVFDKNVKARKVKYLVAKNFIEPKILLEVKSPWNVSFDPKWGGPKNVIFDKLEDWTKNKIKGIRYYSGIAIYRNTIQLSDHIVSNKNIDVYLDLGEVNNLARVRINGKDMGVVWTSPYRLKISGAALSGNNQLEIEVANLWPNRLIGDEQFPDDGIKNGQWPEWLLEKQARTSGRYTFTTAKFYQKNSELLKSGLIGPVRILIKSKISNEN